VSQDQALQAYLGTAGRLSLLDTAGEADLGRRIRAGDRAARDRLVCSNLRLVVHVAKRYRSRRGLSFMDLIQEGNVGLLRAAERWNPDQATRFSTYAAFWIRAHIRRALVKAGTVKVPEHCLELVRRYLAAERALWSECIRPPEFPEICERAGLTAGERRRVAAGLATVRGKIAGGTEGRRLAEGIADARDPGRRLGTQWLIGRLPAREGRVLGMRFGVGGREHTLAEVGNALGVSSERARQLEKQGLDRLRRLAGDE